MNQGQRMEQPPGVVCSKDLNYLEDAMSWELTSMKKCNYFAQQADTERIKQTLSKAGNMHQRHYQMLLNHVDPSKTI